MVKEPVLLFNISCFCLAAFPAISPFANEEFEAKCVNLHTRLEANAEVAKIHLVLFGMCEEQTQVAGDCKEQVVVEWRQIRQLVDKQLRNLVGSGTLSSDAILGFLWEQFVGQLTEPGF